MKRSTQNTLYHLLPVVFWLLAIGGSVLPFVWLPAEYAYGFIPAVLVLIVAMLLRHIPRHTTSEVQCFQSALLLGIASYWLPTVVFLTLPVWVYLVFRSLFDFRSLCATLIGYATVAAWAAAAIYLHWLPYVWTDFWSKENAYGWIPTGAFLIAYIASTIARQNLRAR